MQIIDCEIEKLKPYKNNPRYNKESIKLVAESIKQGTSSNPNSILAL